MFLRLKDRAECKCISKREAFQNDLAVIECVLNGLGMSADWNQNRGTLIFKSHNQLLCSSSPHDRLLPHQLRTYPALFQIKCGQAQCASFFSTTESVLCHICCTFSFRQLGKPVQTWNNMLEWMCVGLCTYLCLYQLWLRIFGSSFYKLLTRKVQ